MDLLDDSADHVLLLGRKPKALHCFKGALKRLERLGLAPAVVFEPFRVVELGNGVSLDVIQAAVPVHPQHYAFLVSEQDFDTIYGKIKARGLQHWADPGQRRPGEINHNDGGRGVYFRDPSGHFLEIITRPYGSGS